MMLFGIPVGEVIKEALLALVSLAGAAFAAIFGGQRRWQTITLVCIFVASAALQFIDGIQSDQSSAELDNQITELNSSVATLVETLQRQKQTPETASIQRKKAVASYGEFQTLAAHLPDGLNATRQQQEQILAFGLYKSVIPQATTLLTPTPSRMNPSSSPTVGQQSLNQVQVTYFARQIDPPDLISALKHAGFDPSIDISRIADHETNAIFFGRRVPSETVHAIALSLLSAGVTINAITPLKDACSPSKSSRIEIGFDDSVIASEHQAFTPQAIDNIVVQPC